MNVNNLGLLSKDLNMTISKDMVAVVAGSRGSLTYLFVFRYVHNS